jgi:hypothetical protein
VAYNETDREREREKKKKRKPVSVYARAFLLDSRAKRRRKGARRKEGSLSLLSLPSQGARDQIFHRERECNASLLDNDDACARSFQTRERENTHKKKNRGVSFESALVVVVVSRDALASSFERISFHFESSPFAFWGKKDAISLSLMLRYLVVVLVAEDKCGRAEEQEEQRRQPRRDDFVLLHLRWFCFFTRARVKSARARLKKRENGSLNANLD